MSYPRGSPIIEFVLRPILLLIIFLMRPLCILLSPITSFIEVRLARQDQQKFEQEIRNEMPFLFLDLGATVVPNEGVPFPPPLDGAFVTLRVGLLSIQFVRGRGDLSVRIATLHPRSDWLDLEVLIGAIKNSGEITRYPIGSLVTVASELRSNWQSITTLLHPDQKPNLDIALREFAKTEQIQLLAFERELNRRLYGN